MLPLEILLRFLSPIERNLMVGVEVIVAHGSRGLELGELLLRCTSLDLRDELDVA